MKNRSEEPRIENGETPEQHKNAEEDRDSLSNSSPEQMSPGSFAYFRGVSPFGLQVLSEVCPLMESV